MIATIKFPWAALIDALRNVAPFASTGGESAVCGVALDYGGDGLAVVATCGRGMCRQDVAADVTADTPGLIVLDMPTVKRLWTIKGDKSDAPAVITVDGKTITITCPEGTVITRESMDGFPQWRPVWDRFIDDMPGHDDRTATAPAKLRFPASVFANLAKIKGGDGHMTMTSGNGRTLIRCGPATICVAQQKKESVA